MPQVVKKDIYFLIEVDNLILVEELPPIEELEENKFYYTIREEIVQQHHGYHRDDVYEQTIQRQEGLIKLDESFKIVSISLDLDDKSEEKSKNFFNAYEYESFTDIIQFSFSNVYGHYSCTSGEVILKIGILEEIKKEKPKRII